MRLFNKPKATSVFKLIARYVAEVVIIFLGITISFLFEQWREDKQERKELIELVQSLIIDAEAIRAKLTDEAQGSEEWLRHFDSIRVQRESNRISDAELNWFYRIASNQTFAIFDPNSPAYLSATNSGFIDKLPDSVQTKIYKLYQGSLRNFQFLYNLQIETISHFRNNTLIPSTQYLFRNGAPNSQIDLKRFALEIQNPSYGNLINQIIVTENQVYRQNSLVIKRINELIETLDRYRKALET